MKKLLLTAMLSLSLLLASGCSAPGKATEPGLLSVVNSETGAFITIGDTRRSAEKTTGTAASSIIEDTLYDIERVSYWDCPGVTLDYWKGRVVAIRLTQEEDSAWQTADGLRTGMGQDEVEQFFAGSPLLQTGAEGSVFLGFDEALDPMAMDAEMPFAPPYTHRVSFVFADDEGGEAVSDRLVANIIAIQDTAPYQGTVWSGVGSRLFARHGEKAPGLDLPAKTGIISMDTKIIPRGEPPVCTRC